LAAGSGYADLLLELHAYLAFAMLALVALHIANALHDYMMRVPAGASTLKSQT
jgi:cytochrome b561